MALSRAQTQTARLLYDLAVRHGLSPRRAREFVAAGYEESGLDPKINNRAGSGAAGLFQLLSPGYVKRANQLGGVYNPSANARAILPDYAKYWASHPGARPGEAARDVERSGQGAGFYSRHLGFFNQLGGGGSAVPPPASARRPVTGAQEAAPDRAAAIQALMGVFQPGPQHGDLSQFITVAQQAKTPTPVAPKPAAGGWKPKYEFEGHPTPKDMRAVELAKNFIGTPYSWGGGGPAGPSRGMGRGAHTTGFDCSSLLQHVWAKQGVQIPRVTYDQWRAGKSVARSALRPGDAVFFRMGGRGPEHVGMYLGGGKFIEAPHTGATVRVSRLAGRKDYVGARRFG